MPSNDKNNEQLFLRTSPVFLESEKICTIFAQKILRIKEIEKKVCIFAIFLLFKRYLFRKLFGFA